MCTRTRFQEFAFERTVFREQTAFFSNQAKMTTDVRSRLNYRTKQPHFHSQCKLSQMLHGTIGSVKTSMSSRIHKTKKHFNLICAILHHLPMPLSNLPVILFSQAVCVSVMRAFVSETEWGSLYLILSLHTHTHKWTQDRQRERERAKVKVIQLYQSS